MSSERQSVVEFELSIGNGPETPEGKRQYYETRPRALVVECALCGLVLAPKRGSQLGKRAPPLVVSQSVKRRQLSSYSHLSCSDRYCEKTRRH